MDTVLSSEIFWQASGSGIPPVPAHASKVPPEVELNELLREDPAAARLRERSVFDEALRPFPRRLVLFGAGNLGRKALRALRSDDIEPLAFADNSSRLWGKKVDGLTVLAPDEAAERYGQSAAFVVTAFSPASNFIPVQQQLHDLDCVQVVPFVGLFWKYAEQCLPHVLVDLPHRVLADRENVQKGFRLFHDDVSRREYVAQVRWRLWQDFAALPPPSVCDQYFPDDLFSLAADERFADCGAFDGDTIRSFLRHCPDFRQIIALEPDPLNFERLQQCVSQLPRPVRERIQLGKLAVAAAKGTVRFEPDGTIAAKILDYGGTEVACDTLDNILAGQSPSYVKLDVEGAEHDALCGAATILRGEAIWAVCVYHKPRDMWQLPLLLRSSLPSDYQLYLRKHGGEIFDTVCYAVPPHRLLKPAIMELCAR